MITPEKAIEELRFLSNQYGLMISKDKPWNRCQSIKDAIDYGIEAINEQRAEGEWIPEEQTFEDLSGTIETYTRFVCSRCNQANGWGAVSYCPWCGAKMEKRHEQHRETDPEQERRNQKAD